MIRAYGKTLHGGVAWLISVVGITVGLSDLAVNTLNPGRKTSRGRNT